MMDTVEFYQKQALMDPSDNPWFDELKQQGLLDYQRMGFPSRRDEHWKYTSVDAFVKQAFQRLEANSKSVSSLPNDLDDCYRISVYNGIVRCDEDLPKGVVVLPLKQALLNSECNIKAYLGQIVTHDHGFLALNTAMLDLGVFVYVPPNLEMSKPLLISHWADQAQCAQHLRHLIVAEENSRAIVIEDYQGQGVYWTNTVTEVRLMRSATLTHYKVQRESKMAYHTGQISVQQAHSSLFHSHLLNIGGQLARSDMTINLGESFAQCTLNGVYTTTRGQQLDQYTRVMHAVSDCRSEQDYKGIMTGKSKAVFNGQVVVAKNAQRTRAMQQNKNLLLSPDAEINTKPQLEIFADDVVCTHGATIGQLDEEALFYLAARGIDRAEASQYLIQAFAMENLRSISDERLRRWISELLLQQIGSV